MTLSSRTFWLALAAALVISRAAHVNILWADEDYHLAAAVQILHGKILYRDLWYDKPPLNAVLFLLFGAWPGWPLRLASVALEFGSAVIAFRFASRLWSVREGYLAATGVAFFHIFFFAHTAIPLEPDSIMVLPHLLAIYWAWRKRPVLAGFAAGLAFLLNTKGAFVLAAALLFFPQGWLAMLGGFCIPAGLTLMGLVATGALLDYLNQVWRWGALYATYPMQEPWTGPMGRLLSWQAFHATLWAGAISCISRLDRDLRWKMGAWLGLSFGAAMLGWRFPPRYFNQVFPPLLILAAGGVPVLWSWKSGWTKNAARALLLVALVIPIVRFGPRYVSLLAEDFHGQPHDWRDATLDRESREAAEFLSARARPGDTIFVWGYRPNVVAYTRLPVAGQLWDSQPITLVPADRHFQFHTPLDAAWAEENQRKLIQTHPTFIADGLSLYNGPLDIHNFPVMAEWLSGYCEIGRAGQGMILYQRCDRSARRDP